MHPPGMADGICSAPQTTDAHPPEPARPSPGFLATQGDVIVSGYSRTPQVLQNNWILFWQN